MQASGQRSRAVVILAAGKGTRMKSRLAKVLHPIGNAPMLHHAIAAAETLSPDRLIVVVGHEGVSVAQAARGYSPGVRIAEQTEQKGTGHAVMVAAAALSGFEGDLFVTFGDTPFLTEETLAKMAAARGQSDVVCLGFEAADPGRYGRLIIGTDGSLEAIVEAKDATPEQLTITACNSGVMAGDCTQMLRLLGEIGNDNAQGEFYLTDLVHLARRSNLSASVVFCAEEETLGINDRLQLAAAERIFQDGARRRAMLGGVTLVDPETTYFSMDTVLDEDVTVAPNVVFGPGVSVGAGTEIRAFCHIEGAEIGPYCTIGPFARIRPGSRLAEKVRIGNFVETKAADIATGSKVNHLSYIGDATLGAEVNIGAGTITCNYDGFLKHRTSIADGAFIGVNTALIAPIHVAENAYVATGTVLTKDVPADALALARTPQQNREGTGKRLREKLAAAKARSKGSS